MASAEPNNREPALERRMKNVASRFPGSAGSPYVDARAELRRVCDWLVEQQTEEGLWPEGKANLRFYSDAYAVRALMAAARLLGDERYRAAARRWIEHLVRIQRSDGGWWVGYGWGDHDWTDADVDQSVVYVADAGEVSLALVCAYHDLRADAKTRALAKKVKASLLRFRNFTEHFRLASGAMGIGYTHRDFYADTPKQLPYMQAHHRPYAFATGATGVNSYAGLYTITGDAADWQRAMQSLDWCLENMGTASMGSSARAVESNDDRDIIGLHRVGDWAFDCSTAPRDEAAAGCPTPEPRFASGERQKLYAVWKWIMHLVADRQSVLGEWPLFRGGKPVVAYNGALRHRLFFGYSLANYVNTLSVRPGEDERLATARDRQLWLCADRDVLREHYGVCMPGAHVMPTGLRGLTLAEILAPGISRPSGIRRQTSGKK